MGGMMNSPDWAASRYGTKRWKLCHTQGKGERRETPIQMWVNVHIKKYLSTADLLVASLCLVVFAGNGFSEVHFVFFFQIFSGLKALPAGTDDIHSRNTDKSPTFIPGRLPLHKFFAPGTVDSVWFTSRLHFATEGQRPMELTAATLKPWCSDVPEQQIHHYYPIAPAEGLWK